MNLFSYINYMIGKRYSFFLEWSVNIITHMLTRIFKLNPTGALCDCMIATPIIFGWFTALYQIISFAYNSSKGILNNQAMLVGFVISVVVFWGTPAAIWYEIVKEKEEKTG